MKPIKPRKLSKAIHVALTNRAERTESTEHMTPEAAAREIRDRHEARAILAALEYERQRTEAVRSIGAQMANVCFNLAQSTTLDKTTRETMDRLRREWDEAVKRRD